MYESICDLPDGMNITSDEPRGQPGDEMDIIPVSVIHMGFINLYLNYAFMIKI